MSDDDQKKVDDKMNAQNLIEKCEELVAQGLSDEEIIQKLNMEA